MWLIKASLRNAYMVATIVFMILVLGVLSYRRIAQDILPVFKTPAVQVLTYFPGMPASSIEKTITNRVERWVNQAPGAAKVESKSVAGVSTVRIIFRDDIDGNAALTMTNSLALGTLPTLPPNTLPPVVLPYDPTGTLPLGVLTVSNPNLDEAKVKDLARIDVRNMLGEVPGCVAPVVVGGKDRTILIYLNPKKMEARKVSPVDVVKALRVGNLMVTPGTAYFGNNQVLLDTNAMVEKVKELNDFPIRIKPGDNVYLRDVGEAKDAFSIQTSRVRITQGPSWEGDRQVYVPIYRQQGASSLAVAQAVRKKVKEIEKKLQAQYPEYGKTRLAFVMDQSFYVKQSIDTLVHEGLLGAALVSLMILVFLGSWRMTLIASLSIPLAVLAAVACLYTTGNTLNAMTLGGLALAIGPLVDDAIVALENIHRNYSMGKSRLRAALDGSVEVMVPVLVATCTTTIVLAPVAMMPGMGGFLFKPLALAVAFAMIASFVLSRTFVPMMCAKFLRDEPRPGQPAANGQASPGGHAHRPAGWFGRLHHRFESFLDNRVIRTYSRLLSLALRRRGLVLGVIGLLFVASLLLAFGIGREFFPQVDAGQITVYVRCPSDLKLDAAEDRVKAVEKLILREIPKTDLQMVISELGLDPDWSAAYTANSGQQDAVVRIQLKPHRRKTSQQYAIQLRHAFANNSDFHDLRFSFDTGGMVSTALNYGASSPLDIEITARDARTGFETAKLFAEQVRGVRGAADVRVLQRNDARYLIIDVDRQKAASAGLSAEDVVLQVVAAMNSSVTITRNFWIDFKTGNQYFVGVQYPEDPNMTLDDVGNLFATGTNQPNTVKLDSLATFRWDTKSVEINHLKLQRTFNVLVNTENRDIAGVASDVKRMEKDRFPLIYALDKLPRDKKSLAEDATFRKRLAGCLKHPQDEGAADALADEYGVKVDDLRMPPDVQIEARGEYERMNESSWNLVGGLGMAALLVYLLQVALFRSWAGPFVIMFTVPLGLIGVLTMLFFTRTTLNVQSQMGVIFLVGIAVNNGVLLVDFANKKRREGLTVAEAIQAAASIRFRPILMTFLATFIALVPMAIGVGEGSEMNVPLGRAVIGGLLTSTVLTLFVVPIMYTLLMRDPLAPEVDLEAALADSPEKAPGAAAPEPHPPLADGVPAAAGAPAGTD
jgi:multidrug efflux pump subunit AcrB